MVYDHKVSGAAKQLLSRMLDKNPMTRISIDEIKEHIWYKYNHIDNLNFQHNQSHSCNEVNYLVVVDQVENYELVHVQDKAQTDDRILSILSQLAGHKHNDTTTIYHLLHKRWLHIHKDKEDNSSRYLKLTSKNFGEVAS